MATAVFSFIESSVISYGLLNGPNSVGGHNASDWGGQNTQVRGAFTGTQLEAYFFLSAADSFEISIDGGAYAALTLTAGAWGYQVVATGLTDALHTFILRTPAGQDPYIDTDTSFRVTGAAPAMSTPVSFGIQKVLADGAVSPYVAAEAGLVSTSEAGYPNMLVTAWTDSSITFRAKCATLSLWMFCYSPATKITLSQDGVDIATITPGITFKFELVTVSTTLDSTTEHTYSISVDYPGWSVYALMTTGGTGLNQTTPISARNMFAFYGDSITMGDPGTGNDSSLAYAHRIGALQSVAVANRGIQGTTVKNFGGNSGEVRYADITGLPLGTLIRTAILYGVNDMQQIGGAETTGQFTASYTNMLNGIIAGTSGAVPIDCLSILPIISVTPNTLAAWNACIVAAIAACSRPSRCTYRDVTASICVNVGASSNYTDPNNDLADGVHPTSSGYAKIAAVYNALLTAASGGNSYFRGIASGGVL